MKAIGPVVIGKCRLFNVKCEFYLSNKFNFSYEFNLNCEFNMICV